MSGNSTSPNVAITAKLVEEARERVRANVINLIVSDVTCAADDTTDDRPPASNQESVHYNAAHQ